MNKYLITLEVESKETLTNVIKPCWGAFMINPNEWKVITAQVNNCLCTNEPPYKECLEHSGY
jgi:hypothetical protein